MPCRLPPALIVLFGVLFTTLRAEETIHVDPAHIVIVRPPADGAGKENEGIKGAALELRQHLALITAANIEMATANGAVAGRYSFVIGAAPADDTKPFAPEEARWAVRGDATYLYGDANNGVLFAVEAFLEEELGVRWIAPGDKGVACTHQATLALTPGDFHWAPDLLLRKLRVDARPGIYPMKKEYVADFWDFTRSHEEHDRYANDERTWQLRMRMGSHAEINYGHAFTNWWRIHGKTHPDYFALKADGKREPEMLKSDKAIYTAANPRGFQNIKLCPSNPAVAQQIVADWLATGRRSKWINVCENDSPPVNFCTCAECVKLDVVKPGEKPGQHLTDRYIHLANAVAREAKKHDPEAGAVIYAYNESEQPPRRERLEPNVLIAIVPTTADLAALDALLGGWSDAGAKQMLVRPNLLLYCASTAIPMGFEKQMFDAFQIAHQHGAIAADYDSLTGLWAPCGMSYYVLAKALCDPGKTFDYWEDHYASAFGPARDAVKAYHRYWREQVFEKKLRPNMDKIITAGRYFNFARGVMWSLDQYYTVGDFNNAEALLRPALALELSDDQRRRVNELLITHEHARLTYQAIVAKGADKFSHSRALLDFRRLHKDDVPMGWLGIFANESRFGDLAGLKIAERLKAYPLPWLNTALAWRFKLDPADVGQKDKWQEIPWPQLQQWELLRTDAPWETPYDGDATPSAALRAQLKNYDGIGWYATSERTPTQLKDREIYLWFGGVDESCWVYVNGKPAGQHVFEKPDDWNTPFEIRMDPFIDWQQPEQRITVRVEDKGGAGGIWKTVWIVSKPKS